MNKQFSFIMLVLILSNSLLATSKTTKEFFYSLPITSNPEEERVFVLNQLARKINHTLNTEGVGSILQNKDDLQKYLQHGKKLSSQTLNKKSQAIYKNITLIENLSSLKSNNQEFNIEKSLLNISIETNSLLKPFTQIHILTNNPKKVSETQFSNELAKLENLSKNTQLKLEQLKENPDQLYLSASYALKTVNSFYEKYRKPFYLVSKNAENPVKMKLKEITALNKKLTFFRDFLNPKRKNKYIDMIDQDLKEIKVGHATESSQKLFENKDKKPNAKSKIKNIRLGKSQKLELVNKDRNI